MLNNVDRAVEKESMQDIVRSYQLLFAKYIYEAGTEGYLHQSFRQDHQAILGDQEIEKAELPVIESFEADCQQYQVVYRSELYGMGRVNKVRMLEEQQKLSLGDAVVNQLVKVVRQEFHHACDVYREIYATDLRDDGQLNDDVLEQEQDRWGLGPSIVKAIASTEQSTFTTDQLEYRRVASQSLHQTGQLDAEALRSLQLQFSFGHSLLEQLQYEAQAEFQTHLETYHQQFLDMLRHNGSIAEADQSRLQDLRQSLGNIHPSLLTDFEAAAIETHEQNVEAYAEEARQVIQQFTNGNVSEPTPEEQESLLALSHWYSLSPAIAAQIEQVVRAELIEQQLVTETAQEEILDSTEPAPEPGIETPHQLDAPDTAQSELSSAMATGGSDVTETEGAALALDAMQAGEPVSNTDITQVEEVQPNESAQFDDIALVNRELVSQELVNRESGVALNHDVNDVDPAGTPNSEPTAAVESDLESSATLTSNVDPEVEHHERQVNQAVPTEPMNPSELGVDAPEEEALEEEAPVVSFTESLSQHFDGQVQNDSSAVMDSDVAPMSIPESNGAEEGPQITEGTHESTVAPPDIVSPPDITEGDAIETVDHSSVSTADTSVETQALVSGAEVSEHSEDNLSFKMSQSNASGGSKRILAVGASIVAGAVLIGGAVTLFRGLGRDNPVPAVDLQSNTVEIAQSGTNPGVTTEAALGSTDAADSTSSGDIIAAETMETLTEVQQLIQDRQVVGGLNLLATVPETESTTFEVDGILRQVFQQAETYYQEGLYAEATTVISTMSQLFPGQDISKQAVITSKEWQNRWHANLATLKVAEDALEKQQYDSAIAEAQKVSHPGLQIQVATIIDEAIQAKQEQATLAESAQQNRAQQNNIPPQSGSPAPRANVAPQRSAPAPRPAPRSTPRSTPQPAASSSQSQDYYSPDPL